MRPWEYSLSEGVFTGNVKDAVVYGEADSVFAKTAGSLGRAMFENETRIDDVDAMLDVAVKLYKRNPFLEKLREYLHTDDDKALMRTVKQCYKLRTGKPPKRTVIEWLKGTTPSVYNKANLLEFCEIMGMDPRDTARFMIKGCFVQPWDCDADKTAARIKELVKSCKERIEAQAEIVDGKEAHISTSKLLEYVYGMGCQRAKRSTDIDKNFLNGIMRSLPNDVTLGKILNGESVTDELLRKTLMVLSFYDFYSDTDSEFLQDGVMNVALDFEESLEDTLKDCGLMPLYLPFPFDCVLMWCACKSEDPIGMLQDLYEFWRD